MSEIKVMNSRTSIRSFSKEELGDDLLSKVRIAVTRERIGPFGNTCRFDLIDTEDRKFKDIGKMTSYGFIKGASLYFGGYSDPDDNSLVDFGYCFQEVLLELTGMGLGTCWLGGTFGRGYIATALALPEGKVIPAISPIGKGLKDRGGAEKLIRFLAKAKKRKPIDQLFFEYTIRGGLLPFKPGESKSPLNLILEAIRFAPSASNRQPWRIVIQEGCIHLYWDYDKIYNSLSKTLNIQALDMGIALCHLEKASNELDFEGAFSFSDPLLKNVLWKYVASWKTDKLESHT